MSGTARRLVEALDLRPHPEGGWYREVHRSGQSVDLPGGGRRDACTAIHYLLEAGSFSAFHKVDADEVWTVASGGPLELVILDPAGKELRVVALGTDPLAGQSPVAVVPAGSWQAARPGDGAAYALCVCVVAPGFEFDGFEMARRDALLAAFPEHAKAIRAFTRGEPPR